MAEGKKSFIAYSDWHGTFKALPDEIAGQLIKYIFSYVNDENPKPHENFVINALFEQVKATLKRDLEKWDKQREQRSLAGKISAERRAMKSNDRSTTVNENTRKSTVNDNVSVNVSVNDNVNEINNSNYIEICLNDIQWLEVICMQNKKKITYVKDKLIEFERHLISTQENKNNTKEFKNHFVNWLKKNQNNHTANKPQKPTF